MQSNIKMNLSFGSIVGLIFFFSLFTAIFFKETVFAWIAPEATEISEGKKASKEIANALLMLDKISLDTSILQSEYFQTIKVLPTFPTDSKTISNFGKANPFLGNFQIVSAPATTTVVGGVINSTQRSVNNGQSTVPVVNGRAQAPQGRR